MLQEQELLINAYHSSSDPLGGLDRFATPSGYRFSCDQLFLRIAPNGRAGARHERIVRP